MRIAIVKNIVAPTTTPLFEHLAARGGCEIFVVYETAMESNRAWTPQVAESYPSVVLDSRTLEGGRWAPGTRVHVPRAPLRDLVRFRPDVVVASGGVWSSPVNNCALLRRRAHGWSFVPWWGEFPDLTRPRQRQLVEPWKRVFVRSGDAWLAYSERARLDAIRLGADPSRTIVALNAPELVPMPQPRRRPAGARRRVLFCGQLVARKGLATLLEATEGLPGIELAVAGDGPLRAEVQRRADRDPSVRYLGHLGLRRGGRTGRPLAL
jgi:glycosyltransferase involved in cell wall biosynthesis